MRPIGFHNECFYHIYNRGVDKRETFLNESYYARFIAILKHHLQFDYPYSLLKQQLEKASTPQVTQSVFCWLEERRVKPPIEIISFCLMPNHFHLTVKQLVEEGVTRFMHRTSTAYTKYFNARNERSGSLFESTFRGTLVESEEQLIHLTRYHHTNPTKIGVKNDGLISYPWSSLQTYLDRKKGFDFISPGVVLSSFSSPGDYLCFVKAQAAAGDYTPIESIAIDDDFGYFAEFRNREYEKKNRLQEGFAASYLKA